MAGTAKAYNLTPEYVLYEMSYVNTLMYGSVLPSYDPDRKKDKKKGRNGKPQEVIKADDPANRDKVRAFLKSIK